MAMVEERDNSIASEPEQRAAENAPQGFGEWLDGVRAQDAQAASQAVPPPHDSHDRPLLRWLFAVALMACAVGGYQAARSILFQPMVEVRGTLVDVHHAPLAGARVFLASNPRLEGITDRRGRFRLRIPATGRRSLVVVAEDAGEEYAIGESQDAVHDLGELAYRVPPRSVRMTPGNGAGWLEEQYAAAVVPPESADSPRTEGKR